MKVKPKIFIGKYLTHYKYVCEVEWWRYTDWREFEALPYAERSACGVGMTMEDAYNRWLKDVDEINKQLIEVGSVLAPTD